MPNTHPDLIEKLKSFLKSGQIITKYDRTLIDTGLLLVTFYLTEDEKNELLNTAEKSNLTLQEYIKLVLEIKLQKKKMTYRRWKHGRFA